MSRGSPQTVMKTSSEPLASPGDADCRLPARASRSAERTSTANATHSTAKKAMPNRPVPTTVDARIHR